MATKKLTVGMRVTNRTARGPHWTGTIAAMCGHRYMIYGDAGFGKVFFAAANILVPCD